MRTLIFLLMFLPLVSFAQECEEDIEETVFIDTTYVSGVSVKLISYGKYCVLYMEEPELETKRFEVKTVKFKKTCTLVSPHKNEDGAQLVRINHPAKRKRKTIRYK